MEAKKINRADIQLERCVNVWSGVGRSRVLFGGSARHSVPSGTESPSLVDGA